MSILAPHHCSGCDATGTLLCDSCKYDIIEDSFYGCVSCGEGITRNNGICLRCNVPYTRGWCIAPRRDALQILIGRFKFTNAKNAHKPLADLLHERLPVLPENIVIVPIPTAHSHIRERGYDHMLLIARRLAKTRKHPFDTSLSRITNTKQRNATAKQRTAQAKEAFSCNRQLDESKIYLLVDDVITTGATIKYAAQTLLDAGAREVWVASISRQPLD